MWMLYKDSRLWNVMPSELLAVSYPEFCLNQAVGVWGQYIEGELDKVEGKNEKQTANKRKNRLLQLLDAPAKQRFRSPRRPPTSKP